MSKPKVTPATPQRRKARKKVGVLRKQRWHVRQTKRASYETTPSLERQLNEYARERGLSRSQIVRQAIKDFLNR